ncbi:MAG: hypothetical protein QOF48_1995 [Verrucomicrobiota bacterium]|jgi:hypothetical protein
MSRFVHSGAAASDRRHLPLSADDSAHLRHPVLAGTTERAKLNSAGMGREFSGDARRLNPANALDLAQLSRQFLAKGAHDRAEWRTWRA